MQPIAVAIDRQGGCGQTSAHRSSSRPSAACALLVCTRAEAAAVAGVHRVDQLHRRIAAVDLP
jgi:hypothetical protein